MSVQLAFGTYRISDRNPEHLNALKDAISSGVRLFDTSTNYMDGGSERAISIAMQGLPDQMIEDIEIVSKFGYIQGSTMQRVKEEETFNNIVKYADHIYHCIDPDFLHDQLKQSLMRLNRESIDCYLIHNPEYFLLDAINRAVDKDRRLDEMFLRIFDAFVALEEEVVNGRIKSYGISSNSFSKSQDDIEFLPYEELVSLARKAAGHVHNQEHHFTTIQLPINLLEQEGLKCAFWAKQNGLRVLANRPLNAQRGEQMYRLADYHEPIYYYDKLNTLLELTDNDVTRTLYNLINELDGNKHRFSWIGEYEMFYYRHIIPHLQKSFAGLSDEYSRLLAESLEPFFTQYAKMVAFECSQATRKELEKEIKGCEKTLQECAMYFLKEKKDIDYILVGMRTGRYVKEISSIFK